VSSDIREPMLTTNRVTIRDGIARVARARSFPAWSALGLLLAWNALFTPGFTAVEYRDGRCFGALIDILHRGAPVMLLALGETAVIGTGGVDLSVGAVMALASSLAAVLLTATGLGVPAVIGASLAAGLMLGLWNGALVGFLRIQPIVATLVLLSVGRGLAELLSGGGILAFQRDAFHGFASGSLFGLSASVWIVIGVFAALALVLSKTTLQLHVEAIGDNERAAGLSGLSIATTKIWVYALCGSLAALSGILVCADVGAADASNTGRYLELDAILSVVIGGTALAGGRISLGGSIAGALVNQALTTSLLMRGLGTETTLCVKAAAVLGVVALQSGALRARWGRAMHASTRASTKA
jgi:ribose/xylose/arabinose/galactoside ABC-type transport system permease subunit